MPKLRIEISDEEFLKKTVDEQNLLMFKKLCSIDQNGCTWVKKKGKVENRKMYITGSASGLVGGALVMLGKLVFWK